MPGRWTLSNSNLNELPIGVFDFVSLVDVNTSCYYECSSRIGFAFSPPQRDFATSLKTQNCKTNYTKFLAFWKMRNRRLRKSERIGPYSHWSDALRNDFNNELRGRNLSNRKSAVEISSQHSGYATAALPVSLT